MRNFILKTTLILSPVILLVAFVNYFGDAANLFSIGYEEKIAFEILKGNNVTNVQNYNERLLQKYLINNSSLCPDVLVIGSSRVMEIRSTNFKGKTFFNNGLSGASIEDIFAIIQMYNQKNCLPKKVIIGLDPWTLNVNNGQSRWLTLDLEYNMFLNLILKYSSKNVDNLFEKTKYLLKKNIYFKELFSPSYFKGSLTSLFTKNRKPLVVSINKVNITATKLSDGSLSHNLEFRSPSKDELEKRVSDYINGDIYSIENFDSLDTNIQTKLEFLIKYLLHKDVNVEFFLAPYHPKVYSLIAKSKKYRQVIESEKYFIFLGVKYGVKIHGSFNPNILNLDNSYFYDGMHCNEKGIEKILMSSTHFKPLF